MKLSEIKKPEGATKNRKRVGRGNGSGYGGTSGRGQNGQKSRSGNNKMPIWFEGGQMPIQRRLPKRGFNNARFRTRYCEINVGKLNAFDDDDHVDVAALQAKGLARSPADGIKILGDGELTKRLTVEAHGFSAGAVAKIEAAGGTVVRLEGKLRRRRKNTEAT